ncbi:MAG: FAD binding domain-containing protein [Candidatus Omnitrophota bacterium]|jgi:CO/xanthine dehydrogenase FAD-binding subunit
MLLNPFTYHRPKSLKEAVDLYRDLPNARLLAGGTMLINWLKTAKKSGFKTPQNIISLKGIPDLQGIQAEEGGASLLIKSMTTFSEIIAHPNTSHIPLLCALKSICRLLGTTQIRNMGTIGGNLTSRYTWTELGAVMISLNATCHFINVRQEGLSCSAEQFFLAGARASGILTHVSLPLIPDSRICYFRKPRISEIDIPLMAVCAQARITGNTFRAPRITINRGTLFPERYHELETFLDGKTAQQDTVTGILPMIEPKKFDPQSDGYKQHLYRIAIRDSIQGLLKETA